MKTLYNSLKIAAGVLILSALAVSCLPEQQSMGDAGQTLLKLYPEGFNLIPLDASTTTQTATLFEVRRDVHSGSALASSTTVVLKKDDAVITAYNTENNTTFIPLPVSLATTNPAPAADGSLNLEFGSGDFTKGIILTIPNASQFDFSKQYALGYKVMSVSGTGTYSANAGDEIVVQVLVKNKYDGVYEVTALSPMLDVANATLTGYYPFTWHLQTSGSNSVKCFDPDIFGGFFHPIYSGTAVSGYGSFGLEVFFDPATGNIVDVKNTAGNPPSNTRMPAIDPSGVNKWDGAARKIRFKYWMKQPSVVTDPPNIRVYFDELWTYKKAR